MPFEHPRQPYELLCSIGLGASNRLWSFFFKERLFDPDEPSLKSSRARMLRCLCARSVAVVQTPLQHTIFGPPVHSHINGVPTGETLRKPSPLAALFRHIQNRVQHLQVRQAHIASLQWQAIFDLFVLLRRYFHHLQDYTKLIDLV